MIHFPGSDRHLEHQEKKNGMGYVSIDDFRMNRFQKVLWTGGPWENGFQVAIEWSAVFEKQGVYGAEGPWHKCCVS